MGFSWPSSLILITELSPWELSLSIIVLSVLEGMLQQVFPIRCTISCTAMCAILPIPVSCTVRCAVPIQCEYAIGVSLPHTFKEIK